MDSAEPYDVAIDVRALKELAKAVKKNKPLERQLTEAIRSLGTDRKTTIKRLTGIKPSLYRKRSEDWRIIFAQSAKLKSVNVLAIRFRNKNTYEQAELQKFAAKLSSDFE